MEYVIAGVGCIFIYWLFTSVFAGKTSEDDELIEVCGGDKGLAQRLIALEKKKKPELSHKEAITRALSSYRRDHGSY